MADGSLFKRLEGATNWILINAGLISSNSISSNSVPLGSITLLMHELTGLLEGVGMDPYLGFLHQIDYGRPSLALDLLEAFRHPIADRLVLTLVRVAANCSQG